MTKVSYQPPDESNSNKKPNNLDLIDDLLRRMYRTLLGQVGESVKIGEFIKMVELRRKLTPEKQAEKELWKLLEKVRSEVLAGKSDKKMTNTVTTGSSKIKKEKKGKIIPEIISTRKTMVSKR